VSLADLLSEPPSMEQVKQEVMVAFAEVFGFNLK